MPIKNSHWFTTLTLLEEKHVNAILSTLSTFSNKYILVTEKGSTGANFHYHIAFVSDKYTRGTKYNDKFKPLYSGKIINKKTIVTKPVTTDLSYFVSYYFFKEGIPIEDIKYKGFSEEQISEMYNKKVLKKKSKLKFDEAPQVILDTIKDMGMLCDDIFEKYTLKLWIWQAMLVELSKTYIIHHLLKNEYEIKVGTYYLYRSSFPQNNFLVNSISKNATEQEKQKISSLIEEGEEGSS